MAFLLGLVVALGTAAGGSAAGQEAGQPETTQPEPAQPEPAQPEPGTAQPEREASPGSVADTGKTTGVRQTAGAIEIAASLEIGALAPKEAFELELEGVDGSIGPVGTWRRENGLLILFSANECPYVSDWSDRFTRLAELGQEEGIGVVLVNSNARKRKTTDSLPAMQAYAEEFLGQTPYLLDKGSHLADLLGAQRTPEAVLIDGQGRLVYRGQIDDHSGPLSEVKEHYLLDAFGALVDGGPMPPATPPLGCAILRPRRRKPPGS